MRASPSDWKARLALARHYDRHEKYADALEQLKEAARLQPRESAIPFTAGLVLLRQGNKQPALEQLRVARDLDPGNWRIRKQIWAIENPEKFYVGDSPDYAWQKAQIDREKRQ